jgi:hypothetical protein
MITIKPRNHVNVTGSVPTISDTIRKCLSLGNNPRVVKAAIDGAANVLMHTVDKKREAMLLSELGKTSWAFVHTPISSPGQQATFTILATF